MTEPRTSRTAEWDAAAYFRLSNPHVVWGQPVLDRLPLNGDETVLDAGCGAGRVTSDLLDRLPDGHVIALDISANMLAEARQQLEPRFGDRVTYVQSDLQEFSLDEPVDAVFSTAALHWVLDHPRLFSSLFNALKSGGRLVAQCGGGPNIATVLERAAALMKSETFEPYFHGWPGPWEFASAETTAERLDAAGFVDIETSLEPKPTQMPDADEYRDYLSTVVFGSHLDRIPDEGLRYEFLDTLTEQASTDDPPFLLDYWRLNMQCRRPAE
ncbi:class I SAM-dependent methyltransferase [soil metagenome]